MEKINLNDYYKKIQLGGDEVSEILGRKAAKTWDHEAVTLMEEGNNIIPTIKIPEGYVGLAHSSTGDHKIKDPVEYSKFLIGDLTSEAEMIGAQPWSFSCDIDARDNYPELAEEIGSHFVKAANKFDFAYLNGEYANLGSRVSDEVKLNIVGMMIYIIPKSKVGNLGKRYNIIDNQGQLFMNADGTGTKPEFSEIKGVVGPIVQDANEMKAGDAARVGSKLLVMHDAFEISRLPEGVSLDEYLKDAYKLAKKLGKEGNYEYKLLPQIIGDRIQSIHPSIIAQNCSGNAIGVINEKVYNQLNSFKEGDFLIVFRGRPNPRSNGITARRTFMQNKFGKDYILNSKNKELEGWLDYLTAPSTLTYSAVMNLTENHLANFFTHMSGGALKSKLLSKLSKKNIGVELHDLFEPHKYTKIMINESGSSMEKAYKALPMDIDGFVATSNPRTTMNILKKHGLESRVCGRLEKMKNPSVGFTAYNGERIEYTK